MSFINNQIAPLDTLKGCSFLQETTGKSEWGSGRVRRQSSGRTYNIGHFVGGNLNVEFTQPVLEFLLNANKKTNRLKNENTEKNRKFRKSVTNGKLGKV